MHGKRLGRSPTFVITNAEMHSASLPINSVAYDELVQNESHSFAGACDVHNPFAFIVSQPKVSRKEQTGFCLMRSEDKAQCSPTT